MSTISHNALTSYVMLQINLLFVTLRDETCLTDSIKLDFGCTRNVGYFEKKKNTDKNRTTASILVQSYNEKFHNKVRS